MNEAYGDHVVNARRMGWSAPTSVGCMGRRCPYLGCRSAVSLAGISGFS